MANPGASFPTNVAGDLSAGWVRAHQRPAIATTSIALPTVLPTVQAHVLTSDRIASGISLALIAEARPSSWYYPRLVMRSTDMSARGCKDHQPKGGLP